MAQVIQAGNRTFQRQANIALIMQTIQQNGTISRVDIARHLGLERSTVTNIVSNLMDYDIVHTVAQGESTSQGGRKPTYLGINPDRVHILGLEIEVGYYRAVVLNLLGQPVEEIEGTLNGDNHTSFSELFFTLYDEVIEQLGPQSAPLVGVGVGIPGPVDLQRGIILQSHTLELENYNYIDKIAARLGLPLYFENDSNCCALGERWKAGNSELRTFMYMLTKFFYHKSRIMDRPGIGFGIMIDGSIYYGSNYRAGEYRSNHWNETGPENIGLSEGELLQLTENPALLERFLVNIFGKLSATFANFDPERIIIGGDLQRNFASVQRIISEELPNAWIGEPDNQTKIQCSSLGENEIAFGAAAMVLDKLFTIPQVGRQSDFVSMTWDWVFSQLEAL